MSGFVTRARTAAVLVAMATGFAASAQEQARNYPDRPMKMLVNYAPGGPTDVYSRLAAQALQGHFKQNVIVENKPGAGAVIGMAALMQAPADGYTFTMQGLSYVGPTFHKSTPFDIQRDFQVVGALYASPFFMAVNATLPVTNLKELVAYSKANPGKVNIAGGANSNVLIGALINAQTGSDMVSIPYKGNAPALTALIANEVQVMTDQFATLRPHVEAGKLRIIATTADKRMSQAPNVPTFAELGFPRLTYMGAASVLVRAGTPAPIVNRLNEALRTVMATPAILERFENDAVLLYTPTPAEAKVVSDREIAFWADAAKAADFKP